MSSRPTWIGHAPPLPSAPSRPSQSLSILCSVCAANNESTQSVSLLVALPSPQVSVDFSNTWPLL